MLTNEGREYGRLLLKMETPQEKGLMSTGTRTVLVIIYIIFCYAVFSFLINHFSETTYDPNGNSGTMLSVLITVMLIIAVSCILIVINTMRIASKMKLLLYENGVIGAATKRPSDFAVHFEEFSLSYDEIYTVSVSGRYVVLHTKWCTYYVLAFKRQKEIIDIINEQREKWVE